MKTSNLETQRRIRAYYQQMYPSLIAGRAERLQDSSNPTEIGSFLEDCLDHLTEMIVVVGAARSADGDTDASSAIESIRSNVEYRGFSSGTYLSHLVKWSGWESTKAVFDPKTTVALSEAEAATRFCHVWRTLLMTFGDPDDWNFSKLNDEVVNEIAGQAIEEETRTWYDLVHALIECRNKLLHRGAIGSNLDKVPPNLLHLAASAVLEIGVCGPALTLLERFTIGTWEKNKGGESQKYFFWRFATEAGALRVKKDENVPDDFEEYAGAEWVLEIQSEQEASIPGLSQSPWATLIGRKRPTVDVLLESTSQRSIRFDQRGEAWLCSIAAGLRLVGDEVAILPLPTAATVTVTLEGESAGNCKGLSVYLAGNMPRSLIDDTIGTVKHTIAGLNNLLPKGRSAKPPILPGMAGKIRLSRSDVLPCGPLGLRFAVVLATARAVAKSTRSVLPNDLQDEILRKVLRGAWYPYRDYYGWVGSSSGQFIGDPLTCPGADLLLLVPDGLSQRPRRVDLSQLELESWGHAEEPTTFDLLGSSCAAVTALIERLEPNPLLPIVRQAAKEFNAKLLVSATNWTVGLLFKRDGNVDAAYKHLQAKKFPPSMRLVLTSTAATMAQARS